MATDGGYFQLSHSVFRDPLLRELPGDAFRLFLWLSSQGWRFPDSDGSLRASVSFITVAIGMPHATVSRGLKLLKEGRLIQLLETDFKRGNLWRITPRAVWSPTGGKMPQRESPRFEVPLAGPATPSNRGGSHLNLSRRPPQFEAEIKNPIPFKKLENSLSDLPEVLRKYFSELRPAKKRESEWRAFQGLKTDYSAEDITDGFAFVSERGVGSGVSIQPCHSPLAYLSKAMGEIMPEVRTRRQKHQERLDRDRREAEEQRRRSEDEERESAAAVAKEQAFQKTFPGKGQQIEVLSDLLKNLPFRPQTMAGRALAIGRWWDGLNEKERQEKGV